MSELKTTESRKVETSFGTLEFSTSKVDDIPDAGVGVDGTDKEISVAEYGATPAGDDYLILGNESFGQVEAVGPNVTEFAPGDYVTATVRCPGASLYDTIGTYDMTTDEIYFERGKICQ